MKKAIVCFVAAAVFLAVAAIIGIFALRGSRTAGTELGSVNTHFRAGGSDRIDVEAIEDPDVQNVVCSLSRARVGGVKGAIGVAEDKSDAHVSCGITGPVKFLSNLPAQADIATENLNATTKTLHVTRFVDKVHNTLSYLVYSDKILDGSPKNDLSMVAIPREIPIPVR